MQFIYEMFINILILLGASSSRIPVPSASPKDQQQQLLQRHYPPEGYEESVMVSFYFIHFIKLTLNVIVHDPTPK